MLDIKITEELKMSDTYTCTDCGRVFRRLPSLKRHNKQNHEGKGVPRSSLYKRRCFEDDCQFRSYHISAFIDHLQNKHAFQIEIENLLFKTFEEFLTWKMDMEAKTKSLYVRKCGGNKGKKKTTYYSCHRSGYYRNNPLAKHRRKIGSPKVEGTCTSHIFVRKFNMQVEVTFCKTHYRHGTSSTNDIVHLPLSKAETASLQDKIRQGMTFDMIQEDFLNECPEKDNISQVLRLKERTVKEMISRHGGANYFDQPDNGVAIEEWVADMSVLGADSPVKAFKPFGVECPELELHCEDFCLVVMAALQQEFLKIFGTKSMVCIDTTLGINTNDLNITSVFVVDDHCEAFPVAFLVSNRLDVNVMTIFFETLKAQSGSILAETFMSYDSDMYYTAWSQVMGQTTHIFLCDWQVKFDFRKNLSKLKKKSLYSEVYKIVTDLMDTSDETQLTALLPEVVNQFLSNADTKRYGEYFQSSYAFRPEVWALCYRNTIDSRVISALEDLHLRLRSLYIDGRKMHRLDKTILELIKIVRDKHYERERKISRQQESEKCAVIDQSHEESLTLEMNVSKTSDKGWSVTSKTTENEKFVIELKDDSPCCDLRCAKCNICPHMYTCNCLDSLVRALTCKHIHFLINWLKTPVLDTTATMCVNSNPMLELMETCSSPDSPGTELLNSNYFPLSEYDRSHTQSELPTAVDLESNALDAVESLKRTECNENPSCSVLKKNTLTTLPEASLSELNSITTQKDSNIQPFSINESCIMKENQPTTAPFRATSTTETAITNSKNSSKNSQASSTLANQTYLVPGNILFNPLTADPVSASHTTGTNIRDSVNVINMETPIVFTNKSYLIPGSILFKKPVSDPLSGTFSTQSTIPHATVSSVNLQPPITLSENSFMMPGIVFNQPTTNPLGATPTTNTTIPHSAISSVNLQPPSTFVNQPYLIPGGVELNNYIPFMPAANSFVNLPESEKSILLFPKDSFRVGLDGKIVLKETENSKHDNKGMPSVSEVNPENFDKTPKKTANQQDLKGKNRFKKMQPNTADQNISNDMNESDNLMEIQHSEELSRDAFKPKRLTETSKSTTIKYINTDDSEENVEKEHLPNVDPPILATVLNERDQIEVVQLSDNLPSTRSILEMIPESTTIAANQLLKQKETVEEESNQSCVTERDNLKIIQESKVATKSGACINLLRSGVLSLEAKRTFTDFLEDDNSGGSSSKTQPFSDHPYAIENPRVPSSVHSNSAEEVEQDVLEARKRLMRKLLDCIELISCATNREHIIKCEILGKAINSLLTKK